VVVISGDVIDNAREWRDTGPGRPEIVAMEAKIADLNGKLHIWR
jgi:hypothetical protein